MAPLLPYGQSPRVLTVGAAESAPYVKTAS